MENEKASARPPMRAPTKIKIKREPATKIATEAPKQEDAIFLKKDMRKFGDLVLCVLSTSIDLAL